MSAFPMVPQTSAGVATSLTRNTMKKKEINPEFGADFADDAAICRKRCQIMQKRAMLHCNSSPPNAVKIGVAGQTIQSVLPPGRRESGGRIPISVRRLSLAVSRNRRAWPGSNRTGSGVRLMIQAQRAPPRGPSPGMP